MAQNRQLRAHLDKNLEIVADYEEKFEKLKVIVHAREVTASDLRTRLAQTEDTVREKEEVIERMEKVEQAMRQELQEFKFNMSTSLEDQQAQLERAKDVQVSILKKTLEEKDKKFEMLQFELDEQIRLNNQKHEEDIKKLQ